MGEAIRRDDLIFDWNDDAGFSPPPHRPHLDDETLRDGLQSPSVRNPTLKEKIEILHLMEALGLDTANIGLPGAGPVAYQHVLEIAKEIVRGGLNIGANCAARTVKADIEPIAHAQQESGLRIECAVFLGSSQIRQVVENWDLSFLLKTTETAVRYAKELDLDPMYVTEDTTRTHPDIVTALYKCAIENGATRIVVADTVGHATPAGTRAIVRHVKGVVEETGEDVQIDWHGHRDRGMDVANAIAAYEAGAHRLHGAANGIGERCGNCPMDTLLVNMKLLGYIDNDLRRLGEYCRTVAKFVRMPIPTNYPVVGRDAFETATGVHAAAVVKALRMNDSWLANRVYSSVPADEVGERQVIRIGPMSGRSNVLFWLQANNIEVTDEVVDHIFRVAKQSDHVLADEEVLQAIREVGSAGD
ncbi:MAG: LeuA family protein [Planctomycetota bacterium]|jgi:2-isopropylmalate synthase